MTELSRVVTVRLPDFYMPYQAKMHADRERAARHCQDWATQFELIVSETDELRMRQGQYALLCSLFYSEATPADLELVTDWMTWQFALDDTFNDTYQSAGDWRGVHSVVSRLRAFLPTSAARIPQPASPMEAALADLWTRTVHRMTPAWRSRFFGEMLAFAETYVWETRNLAEQHVPDLVDHIETRRSGSGTRALAMLLELTMDFDPPEQLLTTRAFTVLHTAAIDAIMAVNDIFSFRKERAHADIHNNVYIYQKLTGCDLPAAIDFVNEMAASRIRLYERTIANDLPAMLDDHHVGQLTRDQVLKWAELLTLWLPGNLEWHRKTGRYEQIELWRPNQDARKFAK